jgi:hypothetical protein
MAAAGYQVGSTCYLTVADAAVAASSSVTGSVALVAGSSAVIDIASVADNSVTYRVSPLNGSAASSLVVPLNIQPCVLPGASEAVQVGWLIAACWIAVYGLTMLSRFAWASINEVSNDA